MKSMLSALLLACALLPAALLGGCAAQPEETPPAEETPVSYTHLDVYKRQDVWSAVLSQR